MLIGLTLGDVWLILVAIGGDGFAFCSTGGLWVVVGFCIFFYTSCYFFKYILMCHNDKIEVGIYGVLLNVMLK